MSRPLVSVIIPVHNGADFLAQAVDSVARQDYAPLEILVIDDGSTDATAALAAGMPNVRCWSQTHAGVAAALNAGIAQARGDWFAFLDHDDLWTPGKLSLQAQVLLDDPTVDLVSGITEQFFEAPALAQSLRIDPAHERLAGRMLSATLIRRTAFERVGPFDPAFVLASGLEWQSRAMALKLRATPLEVVVHRRRIHGANHSLQRERLQAEYFRLLRRSLRARVGQAPP